MSTPAHEQDLVFTRIFDAPRDRVWDAWKNPAIIRQWWGPDGFTCPVATIDFREGGTSLVSMVSRELGIPEQFSIWRYVKIIPMKRIEYLHSLADKDGNRIDPVSVGMPADFPREMLCIVIFEDAGNKTRVTFTEKDWPVGPMMEMSKKGMERCLDKMERALEPV
jgi:uncharacterized protein YndB with AHSA1/START domain